MACGPACGGRMTWTGLEFRLAVRADMGEGVRDNARDEAGITIGQCGCGLTMERRGDGEGVLIETTIGEGGRENWIGGPGWTVIGEGVHDRTAGRGGDGDRLLDLRSGESVRCAHYSSD